jgi:tripartite-type tricarboxylate transporter receptor subunit TctC
VKPSKAVFLASCLIAVPAIAQQWSPSKPVHIIIPAAPGAAMDTIPRMLAPALSTALGQPVVVENRPGANNVIGSDVVAKSAPDGHMLVVTSPSSHQIAYYLVKKLPYDPRKDFTPITAIGEPVTCISVHPSVPAKNLSEFLAWVRKNPGKVAYGSSGVGSAFHLMGELLQLEAKVDVIHVPYKGIALALQDLVGGQVQFAFSSVANALPLVKGGKVRVLAVVAPKPIVQMPGVPPIGEAVPGYERPASWFGYLGPANMPPAITNRYGAELVRLINEPATRAKLEAMGLMVIANTPAEFRDMYDRGFGVVERVVKAAGIQPE